MAMRRSSKRWPGILRSASSGSAPGVCQQLQAAVGTYQADQQLVLQVAQVSDANTQTKITLLAGLVAGTVNAITAVIPSCQNAASRLGLSGCPSLQRVQFTAHYNSILVAPTGNPNVDTATRKLKLHRALDRSARSMTLGGCNESESLVRCRDVHDVRDRMYRASPQRRRYRSRSTCGSRAVPIKDQGEEGSCTRPRVFIGARMDGAEV